MAQDDLPKQALHRRPTRPPSSFQECPFCAGNVSRLQSVLGSKLKENEIDSMELSRLSRKSCDSRTMLAFQLENPVRFIRSKVALFTNLLATSLPHGGMCPRGQ